MEEADSSDFSVISDFSGSYVSAALSPRAPPRGVRVALKDLLEDSPRQVLRDVSHRHTQRIAELEKENRRAVKRTDDVEQQFRKKFLSLKTLTGAREAKLKQRIRELQIFEQQLAQVKQDVRNLDFSSDGCATGVPEEQQALAQFVSSRVQTALLESRMKNESMKEELQDLRSDSFSKSEEIARLRAALESSSGSSESNTVIKETAQELPRCKIQIDELQREKAHLLASNKAAKQVHCIRPVLAPHHSLSGSMDKPYLLQELQASVDRLQTSERDNSRLRRLLDQARSKADDVHSRHVRERDEQQAKLDERLSVFTDRLKRESAKELEDVRVTQKETFEREIRSLRTTRDFSTAEVENLRAKHDEDSRQHESLLEKHRSAVREFEDTIHDLRNSLKLKQFDLDRMQRCLDESSNQKQRLNDENRRFSEKLEHTQSELRDLQERARTFALQQRKLNTPSTSSAPVTPKSGETSLSKVSPALFRCTAIPLTSSTVPKSTNSSSAAESSATSIEAIQAQKQELLKQMHALKSELDSSKVRLSHVDKPSRALIDTIQQREKQLETAQTLMVKLRNELTSASTEVKRVHIEKQHLRDDLRAMCDMKVELDSIRAAILASDAWTATTTLTPNNPSSTSYMHGHSRGSDHTMMTDFPMSAQSQFQATDGQRSVVSQTLLPRFQDIQDLHSSPLKSRDLFQAEHHTQRPCPSAHTRTRKPKLPRAHTAAAPSAQQIYYMQQQLNNSQNSQKMASSLDKSDTTASSSMVRMAFR